MSYRCSSPPTLPFSYLRDVNKSRYNCRVAVIASSSMTHLSQSLDAHRHLHGTMTACSWAAGWRSVLLLAYVDPPCVEEFSTAPTPDQLIVLVTAGACAIEGRYRGKWQRAQYQVGNI